MAERAFAQIPPEKGVTGSTLDVTTPRNQPKETKP
jgi:hypothetical protein